MLVSKKNNWARLRLLATVCLIASPWLVAAGTISDRSPDPSNQQLSETRGGSSSLSGSGSANNGPLSSLPGNTKIGSVGGGDDEDDDDDSEDGPGSVGGPPGPDSKMPHPGLASGFPGHKPRVLSSVCSTGTTRNIIEEEPGCWTVECIYPAKGSEPEESRYFKSTNPHYSPDKDTTPKCKNLKKGALPNWHQIDAPKGGNPSTIGHAPGEGGPSGPMGPSGSSRPSGPSGGPSPPSPGPGAGVPAPAGGEHISPLPKDDNISPPSPGSSLPPASPGIKKIPPPGGGDHTTLTSQRSGISTPTMPEHDDDDDKVPPSLGAGGSGGPSAPILPKQDHGKPPAQSLGGPSAPQPQGDHDKVPAIGSGGPSGPLLPNLDDDKPPAPSPGGPSALSPGGQGAVPPSPSGSFPVVEACGPAAPASSIAQAINPNHCEAASGDSISGPADSSPGDGMLSVKIPDLYKVLIAMNLTTAQTDAFSKGLQQLVASDSAQIDCANDKSMPGGGSSGSALGPDSIDDDDDMPLGGAPITGAPSGFPLQGPSRGPSGGSGGPSGGRISSRPGVYPVGSGGSPSKSSLYDDDADLDDCDDEDSASSSPHPKSMSGGPGAGSDDAEDCDEEDGPSAGPLKMGPIGGPKAAPDEDFDDHPSVGGGLGPKPAGHGSSPGGHIPGGADKPSGPVPIVGPSADGDDKPSTKSAYDAPEKRGLGAGRFRGRKNRFWK